MRTRSVCATFRAAAVSAALLVAPVGASDSFAQTPALPTLAIERVTVLPMDRDTAMVDHTILVSRDRIAWIGPSRDARIPAGTRRVDGRGAFVIPGLADMHVHLESAQDLAQLVEMGVTTVRNMRGSPRHLTVSDSVANGTLDGPKNLNSGPYVSCAPQTVSEE